MREVNITERSRQLFIAYAKDAENLGGSPLVGGNVSDSKEDRSNLTQLKQAGLVKTEVDEELIWLYFTPKGKAYAKELGVTLRNPITDAEFLESAEIEIIQEANRTWSAYRFGMIMLRNAPTRKALIRRLREMLHAPERNVLITHPPAEERRRRYTELTATGVPAGVARSLRDLRPTKYRLLAPQAASYWSGREIRLAEMPKYRWWKNPIRGKTTIEERAGQGLSIFSIIALIVGIAFLVKMSKETAQ